MKVNEIKEELQRLSVNELKVRLDEMRQELFGYRLNSTTAHVKDYSQFKKLRKHIARGETRLTYLRKSNVG
jgi:ribosomal protein L29